MNDGKKAARYALTFSETATYTVEVETELEVPALKGGDWFGLVDAQCPQYALHNLDGVDERELCQVVELPSCAECTNGWVHVYDEEEEQPNHIERCDSCRQLASDEDAFVAHARDCQCILFGGPGHIRLTGPK